MKRSILVLIFYSGFGWASLVLKQPEIAIKKVWIRETFSNAHLAANVLQFIPPVLTDKLVIQANTVNGLQAYTREKGKKKWEFKVRGGLGSKLLLAGEQLFFGGVDGFVYALLAKTGGQQWKHYIGSASTSLPVLFRRRLYIADPARLYCLNAKTGKVLWTYSVPVKNPDFVVAGVAPPLVTAKLIYFKASDGTLTALNHQAKRKWKRILSHSKDRFTSALSKPVMGKFCLYSAGFESGLYCLNKWSGKVVWRASFGSHGDPLLFGEYVFYPTSEGHILALDQKSGKQIWIHKVPHSIASNLTIYKKYLIYGEYSGALRFLSRRTGLLQESFYFGKGLSARPLLSPANSMLYFISNHGWLYKLSLR